MKRFVFLVVMACLLSAGCATTSDDLRSKTAGVLGYAPDDVTISNMRSDATTTYYVAKTPKGEYACSAESGATKVFQLGLTNPPTCMKKE
jgi:hypothetical protein